MQFSLTWCMKITPFCGLSTQTQSYMAPRKNNKTQVSSFPKMYDCIMYSTNVISINVMYGNYTSLRMLVVSQLKHNPIWLQGRIIKPRFPHFQRFIIVLCIPLLRFPLTWCMEITHLYTFLGSLNSNTILYGTKEKKIKLRFPNFQRFSTVLGIPAFRDFTIYDPCYFVIVIFMILKPFFSDWGIIIQS